MGDNSLNITAAHLTLSLAASFHTTGTKCVTQTQNFDTHSSFIYISTSVNKTAWSGLPSKHSPQWKSILILDLSSATIPLWYSNHPIPLLQYHWCWQLQKRHSRFPSLHKASFQCIRPCKSIFLHTRIHSRHPCPDQNQNSCPKTPHSMD